MTSQKKNVLTCIDGLVVECQTSNLKFSISNPPRNFQKSFHITPCTLLKIAK